MASGLPSASDEVLEAQKKRFEELKVHCVCQIQNSYEVITYAAVFCMNVATCLCIYVYMYVILFLSSLPVAPSHSEGQSRQGFRLVSRS